jgi:allantoate deiminase
MAQPPDAPSGARILERCDALARCSEEPAALTRVFLSPEQRAASALVLGWMREAGMDARQDEIGNAVGRYEGTAAGAPCLMLGSHLDTVRNAGKYDGMLGVVAAIDCVRALRERGVRLPHAIEVVGFADEEGVRFGTSLLGSRAVAGTFDAKVLESRDAHGLTLREAMLAFGLDPAHIGRAARRREDVLAYAELHIEQGPVLEAEGLPVGVVTAIGGATRYSVDVEGMAGHAGTVPMALRQDALAAAAECVLAVEARCASEPDLVGTVGRIEAAPGATNVIPGNVRFTVDVRAPRDAQRRAAAADIEATIAAICARRRVGVRISRLHEEPTTACAVWLQEQLGNAIAAEGLPVRRLHSGAGHDGIALVALADVGMLFLRCQSGVSHNPLEAIAVEDAELSARVLLRFVENFSPDGRRA